MSKVINSLSEDDNYYEPLTNIKAVASEHFINYLIVVMHDDGEVSYEYTNHTIGKTLAREVSDMINDEIDIEIDWDDSEIEDD